MILPAEMRAQPRAGSKRNVVASRGWPVCHSDCAAWCEAAVSEPASSCISVAGQAVRSQLSPGGNTLAVLCAGMNSLDNPDGSTDTASTQFIFLYDVSGNRKQAPQLTQVIQQPNAYLGLVFSPDGSTLYAAGGGDIRRV